MNSLVTSVFRICEKKWVEIYDKYSFYVIDKKIDLIFDNKKNIIFDIEAQQFVGECINNRKNMDDHYYDWKYKNMDNDEESKIIIMIDY